ncbi:MAG: adenylosuccinate synthase [Saprospiraceae bacterium]|nr:adenylosuccinate synthase [Saprospiraceae bacterium]
MAVDVILGLQWGDEGKGKIVDFLAPDYQIICRFQGGPNAGHTLKFGGKKHVLHTVPSGIFRSNLINLIGNGVVIDPITLAKELAAIKAAGIVLDGNLLVARKAHLILPTHRLLDQASEAFKGKSKIGSTLRGIGPTYMDKTGRNGLRVGDLTSGDFDKKYQALKEKHLGLLKIYPEFDFDLDQEEKYWMENLDQLRSLPFVDGEYYLNEALSEGKRVLAEGAQGSMLDIDFGTYPYVTSSNTISAGACIGLGIAPKNIGEVIGITKAYCTRVGSGPFPSELFDEDGTKLGKLGMEFGATTGRARRCGWLDIPQLKYTIMINGVTQLVMTKIDVLDSFETIKVAKSYQIKDKLVSTLPFDICDQEISPVWQSFEGWQTSLDGITAYEDLPGRARGYIQDLESTLGVPFSMISTGPERSKLILRS